MFFSGPENFRFDIAKKKPYKGNRGDKKPWHFKNITEYMLATMPVWTNTVPMEADDMMAIRQVSSTEPTIICSRDKDLRQVPGKFYSWELGNQPSFGPIDISKKGSVILHNNQIKGTGFAFFASQVLTGDPVDNIPGLPKWGPVKTYNAMAPLMLDTEAEPQALTDMLIEKYTEVYGNSWEEELLEQGQLLWICRRFDQFGMPERWKIGLIE